MHLKLKEMKELYERGKTLYEVGEILNIPWQTIHWNLKKSGFKFRHSGSDWIKQPNPAKGKHWPLEMRERIANKLRKSINEKKARPDGYFVTNVMMTSYKYHRFVMEKHIGRKLKPEEVVHHIDENKANNDISNLMLLPNNSAHLRLHWQLKKAKLGKK